MRRLCLTLLIAVSTTAMAQAPGTQLTVDVTIKSLVLRGDTVGITYTVFNRATSRDSLFDFTVDAPAGVKIISQPLPDTSYMVLDSYHGRPVADWGFLNLLIPSATSIPLYFESVGLPGIVTEWAGGDVPIVEESADTLPDDRLAVNSVQGKTVGVNPWPVDRTSKALIARLRSLTQTSCASPLTWITSATLCTKLIGYLDQAESNRAAGKRTQAKAAMNNYITSLSGKTAGTFASGVTNPGYWLLKPNADIINGIL
jgi:hypothetical protein